MNISGAIIENVMPILVMIQRYINDKLLTRNKGERKCTEYILVY